MSALLIFLRTCQHSQLQSALRNANAAEAATIQGNIQLLSENLAGSASAVAEWQAGLQVWPVAIQNLTFLFQIAREINDKAAVRFRIFHVVEDHEVTLVDGTSESLE